MRVNPVLAGMTSYPFVRLTEAKRAAIARGVDVIDFGVGEPREVTPAFIPRALERALADEPVSTYPLAEGLPELCEAIASWAARRFGAALDPATEVIPTHGLEGGDLQLRPGLRRPRRPGRRHGAGLSGGRAGRAVRRRVARRGRRSTPLAAGSPTSTPSTGTESPCCG